MYFGKLVTLPMFAAFAEGVGYSYFAEKHGLPNPVRKR